MIAVWQTGRIQGELNGTHFAHTFFLRLQKLEGPRAPSGFEVVLDFVTNSNHVIGPGSLYRLIILIL